MSTTAVVAARRPAGKKQAKAKPGARPKLVWRKRDTQDSQLYNLKLDINDIKQEIQRLTLLRSIAQAQTLNRHDDIDGSCQKVVVEYFQVFAKGFAASPYNTLSYIYHAMSDDIQVNNFQGRDMVLEQWKMHSATFEDLDFRFVDAMVIPLGASRAVVKTTARFHATITRQTLAIMFPHIMHREDIILKLLGKPIADFGRYDFEIDAKTMQITRCDVVLDFFSCFAKILKNPLELAALFGQALLFDEFYIGDVDDIPVRAPIQDEDDEDEELATVSPIEIVQETVPPSVPTKMRLDHILGDDDELANPATSVRPGEAF